MPRFKVPVYYRVKFYREAEIEVEADSAEEAEELALDEVNNGDVDWEDGGEEHDGICAETPVLIAGAYDECCAGTSECPCLHAPGAR